MKAHTSLTLILALALTACGGENPPATPSATAVPIAVANSDDEDRVGS